MRNHKARRNLGHGLVLSVSAIFLTFGVLGCTDAPKPAVNADDPAGLGAPKERLKMLQADTMMDPRLKAKKMAIIEDEINGTHNARPGHH